MKLDIKKDGKDHLICNGKKVVVRIVGIENGKDTIHFANGIVKIERNMQSPVNHMEIKMITYYQSSHTQIFPLSYDGNRWGTDHEYKGFTQNGVPYTFAYHRTAVPGGSSSVGFFSETNESVSTAVYGEEKPSASLYLENGAAVHRLIWPETEEPCVLMADGWGEAYYGKMYPADLFIGYLFIGDEKEEAWKQMLSYVFKKNDHILKMQFKAAKIWKMQCSYAKELYTEEDDGFCGFSIGFTRQKDRWEKRTEQKYEMGWCGQNISLAVSLLYDYQMNGDVRSKEIALKVLDSWSDMAKSDYGYPLTRYDDEEQKIDACNLGTGGMQFFEAYEMTKKLGFEKKVYLETALFICDFIIKRQRLDGGVGTIWDKEGMPLVIDGTAGDFLILPLIKAYAITKEDKYSIAAARAYSFYFREFDNNGYGVAGALDTCCIDKESIIPLLKGGIMMYEEMGFDKYLDMAEEAAWYLSGWQWHHTVPYDESSILHTLDYDTFGGTAVSTSHLHIDAFALCYVNDLLKLSKYKNNKEWERRALAIWCNGIQGISDGTLTVMGSEPRPVGSSDEGYLHTRWGSLSNHKDGWARPFGVSQWLVAWPGAFRLEVLRACENWNFLDGYLQ